MKIALNLIKIFVFILALYILTQNSSQFVDIKLLNNTYTGVNLLIVILVTLTVGAMLGAIFMALSAIQSRAELKSLRNKNRQLLSELESLRNISIDEIPEEEAPQPSSPAVKTESP